MIHKFRGAILGTAIGDALGAPMETLYADDIAKKYPNFIKDQTYVESKTRRKGQWTDDTQLMIPTAWSIVFKNGIAPQDIARQYVDVAENQIKRGWGRSTIQSIKQLSEGISWMYSSQESLGIGNGAAMKAAPLGLVLAGALSTGSKAGVRHTLNSIVDVGKITHKEIGVRAGLLQSVLITLAVRDIKNPLDIVNDLKHCERECFGDSIISDKVEILQEENTINEICKLGGLTSKAQESWPTTAAVYLYIVKGKTKPLKALFELINQGGDCDTTGAMLGCLIGARYGLSIFSQKLIRHLEQSQELQKLADALYESLNESYRHNIWSNFLFREYLL